MLTIKDVYNSKAVALYMQNAHTNSASYLGAGFFPTEQKGSIDLKLIKGSRGLPISLSPSAFDTTPKFRDRIGLSIDSKEMAFFRESMIVKEKDEIEIARAQEANDPYVMEALSSIYDDVGNLVDGARVVPERMIMQLLAPIGGDMGISIVAGGTDYTYNYDEDGSWKAKHYSKIEGVNDKWNASETCDPIRDLQLAMSEQEATGGAVPTIALMSQKTFNDLKNSAKFKAGVLAFNPMAIVNMTTSRAKAYVKEELNLDVLVYNKMFRDEEKVAKRYYADDIVMLLPGGALGKTYRAITPEERTLRQVPGADVSVIENGIAISVTTGASIPVNTTTTVSQIVLPTFERMNDCYALEVN